MLGDAQQLYNVLRRLDGKGYKAYRDIEGSWQFDGFRLLVDHVQGDSYAAPSRLRVQVNGNLSTIHGVQDPVMPLFRMTEYLQHLVLH